MVGKGSSIGHGGNSIDYALEKDQAEILDKKLCAGETSQELQREFRTFQDLNPRTKNNTISFVLSPDKAESQRLSNAEFRKLGNDFLKKMGLENHQSITIKHNDKDHKHLHIYVNRIDENGKAYKDNFIGKKSQRIADEVAKEHKLIQTKEREKEIKRATKALRKEIHGHYKEAIKTLPRNFEEYKSEMKKRGIKVQEHTNRQGRMLGYKVEYKGKEFKSSKVHRSMTLSRMGKEIEQIQRRGRGHGLSL